MKRLTIKSVKEEGLLIFETVAGSKAYGLHTASSDTDLRGVFILPQKAYYGFEYTAQVSNETNDIVYYELGRFVELLSKNNPNILELLCVPQSCVLHKDSIIDLLKPDLFLSKQCEQSFANYAYAQIKKAYGLEKKIVNPVDEKRKSVLDFCFVHKDGKVIDLNEFLLSNNFDERNIGLVSLAHIKDSYNLFYSDSLGYSGIIRKDESNDVCVSSVPKGETSLGLLYFNRDAYSIYCKKYKEYWDWVQKRNDERYESTMRHGKKYDAKNMMHVFRLLLMAKEIALESRINVFRNDREFLLAIKEGKFEYDELLEKAETLKNELPELFAKSSLPEKPDADKIGEVLFQMRDSYYKRINEKK